MVRSGYWCKKSPSTLILQTFLFLRLEDKSPNWAGQISQCFSKALKLLLGKKAALI